MYDPNDTGAVDMAVVHEFFDSLGFGSIGGWGGALSAVSVHISPGDVVQVACLFYRGICCRRDVHFLSLGLRAQKQTISDIIQRNYI